MLLKGHSQEWPFFAARRSSHKKAQKAQNEKKEQLKGFDNLIADFQLCFMCLFVAFTSLWLRCVKSFTKNFHTEHNLR